MCWNPTRQAYVALFPPLSFSLFISEHLFASPLPSFLSLPLSFFLSSVPWFLCGHSVRCVCLSPSAICFPDRGRNWSTWRWALAKQLECTHLQIPVFVCTGVQTRMRGHTDTCICTDESTLVLKTPTDFETDIKTSGMERNRKRVVKEKAACCLTLDVRTRKLDLWSKQPLQQIYAGSVTHLMCANEKRRSCCCHVRS